MVNIACVLKRPLFYVCSANDLGPIVLFFHPVFITLVEQKFLYVFFPVPQDNTHPNLNSEC